MAVLLVSVTDDIWNESGQAGHCVTLINKIIPLPQNRIFTSFFPLYAPMIVNTVVAELTITVLVVQPGRTLYEVRMAAMKQDRASLLS